MASDRNKRAIAKQASRFERDVVRAIARVEKIMLMILAGLCLGILYFAKSLLAPLLVGALIALVLRPVVRSFETKGIPASVVAVTLVITLMGAIGLAAYTLNGPMSQFVSSAPVIAEKLERKFYAFQNKFESLNVASKKVENLAKGDKQERAQEVVIKEPPLIASITSSLANAGTIIFFALIFALLLLASGGELYQRIVGLSPTLRTRRRTLETLLEAEKRVSRYLLTITVINVSLGTTIAALLGLVGVPNYIIWGIFAAFLNFIPFLGAMIGVSLLALVSLAQEATIAQALIAPAIYLACTTIEGNFVTPWLVGRRVEINMVAVFLGVVCFGWLWGILGTIVAVPTLVILKVILETVDGYDRFDWLLDLDPGTASPDAQPDEV